MEEKWLGQIFFLLSFVSSFWCISCCGKVEEALLGQFIINIIIMIIIIGCIICFGKMEQTLIS
jgi:hypothetical protein